MQREKYTQDLNLKVVKVKTTKNKRFKKQEVFEFMQIKKYVWELAAWGKSQNTGRHGTWFSL